MAKGGWQRPFEDPVPLPNGRRLATLKDAAGYIMKLSKAERELPEWQLAGETLIDAAEGRDFMMHARIGMLRAINAGKPAPAKAPRRKRTKAYRVIK